MELRFFGGLSVEETAQVLKISRKTVQRIGGWRRCGCCASWLRSIPMSRERWEQVERLYTLRSYCRMSVARHILPMILWSGC